MLRLVSSWFDEALSSTGPVGDADTLSGALASCQELAREPLGLVGVGEGGPTTLTQGTDPAPAVIDGDRAEEVALDEDRVSPCDVARGLDRLKADEFTDGNDGGFRHIGSFR